MRIRDIEEHARRDPLTGCFNRRYLVAALEEQKRLADEHGVPLCLAVLDLDHFKRINDEVGHLAGDEVLRTFSRVALENIRSTDIFGRYGGEEFLLVLPETPLLSALNMAERIREQVEHHAWSGKLHGLVTVSIGLTQYIDGESVLDLFSRTDTAMYLAKRGGRNQVVVEEPNEELWQSTGNWAR
jgi:diguanylate cyclase (GGDEF)-like protein